MSVNGNQVSRAHHKLGFSPIIAFIVGASVLLAFAAATTVQVQTSEFLALHNPTRVAGVAWAVLAQPAQLLSGQVPIMLATAYMYAWIVEIITLVYTLFLSVAVVKLERVGRHLSRGFVLFGALLIGLNSWADYSSSPGDSALIKFLIALAIGGVVVIGLPLGIGLIEHGIEEL